MSDVSTNLSHGLFTSTEVLTCSVFNLKIFLLTIAILLVIGSLMMMAENSRIRNRIHYVEEEFGNDQFFSYKDTWNPGYFTSQSAHLTSVLEGSELLSGFAQKNIIPDPKDKNQVGQLFHLDLYCNLNILNGNPFGMTKANEVVAHLDQHYLVYLMDNKGKKEYVDKLKKDGDGMYKLKFVTSLFEKYVNLNQVVVVHTLNGKETPLLSGKFTLV